ncbi:MAG: hypothetical protein M1832_001415 [Thelocarpon impressellum]|nr:MAG: hypothetical protein M1832_001415 [Thelocarpon impressellum]
MARATVAGLKFVGTISLGLLTGLSYSLATLSVPSLLALPSAAQAHHSFSTLQSLSATHTRLLSALSATSLVLAYALSPSRARHPYLLWTTLTVGLALGGDAWFARRTHDEAARLAARGSSNKRRAGEDETTRNGEEVRRGMEGWGVFQAVRAGVSGLGFGMSVAGLWGDGY